jgi:hypothetical protein
MSEATPPVAVTRPVEAVLAKLEPALAGVADALAKLSPAEWKALEHEEWGAVFAAHQAWDVAGLPGDRMIPQFILGYRIIELFIARHPSLVPPPPREEDSCRQNRSS